MGPTGGDICTPFAEYLNSYESDNPCRYWRGLKRCVRNSQGSVESKRRDQYCEFKGTSVRGGESDRKGREGTSRLVYTSWHAHRADV